MKDTVLTGISEVEVIFNITSDVVVLFVLYPMCVCLLIIPDENSKQHNHSYLPDKADGRKTNTHIGVLGPAKEIPHNVTKVPHVDDSADDAQLGSLSLSTLSCSLLSLSAAPHQIFMEIWGGVPHLETHAQGVGTCTC